MSPRFFDSRIWDYLQEAGVVKDQIFAGEMRGFFFGMYRYPYIPCIAYFPTFMVEFYGKYIGIP